jgi:hypothetical protein
MRTLIIICLTFITTLSYAQELMTIGEVFSFEVGDKFHYGNYPGTAPPAADRVTITDKYFSASGDTVFYERYSNSYYSYMVYEPELHLEYHFSDITDTVFYTNLDSLISYYDTRFQCEPYMYSCDTIIENSAALCNVLINGYGTVSSDFEPTIYVKRYGQGLGWVWDYISMFNIIMQEKLMFYYQKNGIECGTPDNLAVSNSLVPGMDESVSIFPNPARDYFNVKINTADRLLDFRIFNIYGALIDAGKWTQEMNRYNCVGFKPGVYIIEVKINERTANYKMVVE